MPQPKDDKLSGFRGKKDTYMGTIVGRFCYAVADLPEHEIEDIIETVELIAGKIPFLEDEQ